MKKKIGFVFLDDIHHIYHFISVFKELYYSNKYFVEIITFDTNQQFLIDELEKYCIPESVIFKAPTFFYRKILNKLRQRKIPSPVHVLKKNKKELLGFDALIFNVPQHKHIINSRKGLKPFFIQLGHGPGVGTYQFDKKFSNFDLITVSGKKDFEIYKKNPVFNNVRIKICGYQKFDAIELQKKKLFDNDNLTVIYNPHFKDELTSYHKKGREILDFFYKNEKYNLIFAPHINLFNKKGFLKKENFESKFLNAKNIIVDFGSENSVNMTYTLNSDVYLGDVSSQLYEFLKKPRPCIFVNSSNIDWEKESYYSNWKVGKVISDINKLQNLLNSINDWEEDYKDKQKMLIENIFDFDKKLTASQRIAIEIEKLINKKI